MSTKDQTTPDWPPKLAVCVGTVVLQGDRALLVRQAEGHALAGQWSIPWGVVDPDETPESAALRETEEEAGVKASMEGLIGLQNLRQEGWIALVFLCHHISGDPEPDGGIETDAAAYFSLDEIVSSDEPIEPWCEWLLRRVLTGDYHFVPSERNNPYTPRLSFF